MSGWDYMIVGAGVFAGILVFMKAVADQIERTMAAFPEPEAAAKGPSAKEAVGVPETFVQKRSDSSTNGRHP